MPHACLAASRVAVRTHLLRQQLGMLHVADAVIGSFFRQILHLSLKGATRFLISLQLSEHGFLTC